MLIPCLQYFPLSCICSYHDIPSPYIPYARLYSAPLPCLTSHSDYTSCSTLNLSYTCQPWYHISTLDHNPSILSLMDVVFTPLLMNSVLSTVCLCIMSSRLHSAFLAPPSPWPYILHFTPSHLFICMPSQTSPKHSLSYA